MTSFYQDAATLISAPHEQCRAIVAEICRKHHVSQEAVYWRIRTYFGDKLRNLRWNYFEPSREELLNVVLRCQTSGEVFKELGHMPRSQQIGLFDRVLGVSTFAKAKMIALHELYQSRFSPAVHDNKALVAAMLIGDGYWDLKRRSIDIEHCAKQQGWLQAKVDMFCAAFPYANKTIKQTKRGTFKWRSNKITSTKYVDLCSLPRHELVHYLNPLGLWVLFLDDGCYCRTSQQVLQYAAANRRVAEALQSKLNDEYGFQFRIQGEYHNLVLTGGAPAVFAFIQDILQPFSKLTPECMHYKIAFEDIVHRKLS